mgnify:CR=1 FL=1|tara:strand:- start:33964 stop:36675 length:2712 start_codon:yes stop_codon:yes gene_type:complete
MKLFNVLCILLLISSSVIGQFNDDFSDGDFTNDPTWVGQDSLFKVNSIGELQLNDTNSITDEAFLIHNSWSFDFSDSIIWDFRIKLLFDNPSSSNQTRFYLTSSNFELSNSLNGYYISIGETGSEDKIKLYRQDGTTSSLICSGQNTFSNDVNLNVRVTRDSIGNWGIFSDTTLTSNFVLEATGIDDTYTSSNCFGVYCKYTSTRSTKFIFDDISIEGQIFFDSIAPSIVDYNFECSNILEIIFDEILDSSYSFQNFLLIESNQNPIGIENNDNGYQLNFETNFIGGDTLALLVSSIEDLYSNVLNDTFYFLVPDTSTNVLLSDNFCDGDFINSPSWYGDDSLFYVNVSGNLQLNDSQVIADNACLTVKTGLLDFSDSLIWDIRMKLLFNNPSSANQPRFYLVSDNENLKENLNGYYISIGEVGENDKINLYRQDGLSTTKICSGYFTHSSNINIKIRVTRDIAGNWLIESDSTVTGGNFVYEGGCTDTNHTYSMFTGVYCRYTSSYSTDYIFDDFLVSGHSIFDTVPPIISKLKVAGKNKLLIEFSEPINSSAEDTSNYIILGTNQFPNNIFQSELGYQLNFDNSFKGGDTITLSVSAIEDFSFNILNDTVHTIVLDTAKFGELLFNELLFDPIENGSEYVEIFNNSAKRFNLNQYFFAKLNEDKDSLVSYEPINNSSIIDPGELLLFTKYPSITVRDYFNSDPSRFVALDEISNSYFTNSEETIYLLSPDSIIIDVFNYSVDMHFELIDDPSGVSLEKISPSSSSNNKTLWHSASENSGWGTPGLQNSQLYKISNSNFEFTIETKVFSPDNDGFDDIAIFSYNLSEVGLTGSITVFDQFGRLIKKVKTNELLGNQGVITWDGTNEQGQKANVGIYLVLFEYFNSLGEFYSIKKTITLKTRF